MAHGRQHHVGRFIPARAGNTCVAGHRALRTAVHPRSRGEHADLSPRRSPCPGSSPLARGTPATDGRSILSLRFIPARAGNTPTRGKDRRDRPVHPRSRGEHIGIVPWFAKPIGSSPLARGTRGADRFKTEFRRFIPARAGNTHYTTAAARFYTVHPRSRGEHPRALWHSTPANGSSPLARGTHALAQVHVVRPRFIPARAGNTARAERNTNPVPVHPRSRGEHPLRDRDGGSTGGSSPLARGTRAPAPGTCPCWRFIPARAGNTDVPRPRGGGPPVHPRSRGEHRCTADVGFSFGGSSPLARGTPRLQRALIAAIRFIPARAGNTRRATARPAPPPVHPRSRGEHRGLPVPPGPGAGSSPLARGTPGY